MDSEVIVVGAGPSGLALANVAIRRGMFRSTALDHPRFWNGRRDGVCRFMKLSSTIH